MDVVELMGRCFEESEDTKDALHFYDTKDPQWCQFLSTPLPTRDAKIVEFSANGRYIAVFESCLNDSIFILSADGVILCTLKIYDDIMASFPTKSLKHFVLSRYDNSCLLYNHANWKILAELKHPLDKPIDPILGLNSSFDVADGLFEDRFMKPHKVAIYLERSIMDLRSNGLPFATTTRAEEIKDSYVISKLPYTVKSIKIDPKKPNPRVLASVSSHQTVATWLVELLCHSSAVTCVHWDPRALSTKLIRLAFCTAAGRVFIWDPRGCLCLTVERPGSPFPVKSLSWSSSGDALILRSSKSFCMLSLDSKLDDGVYTPLEHAWTAPFTGRDPLEEHKRDPQTPASHGNFPADAKSDLPKWALSAHRQARNATNG
ncbi:hypothetical protein Aperf_G00000070293 [Anoplocephala perfoliata]